MFKSFFISLCNSFVNFIFLHQFSLSREYGMKFRLEKIRVAQIDLKSNIISTWLFELCLCKFIINIGKIANYTFSYLLSRLNLAFKVILKFYILLELLFFTNSFELTKILFLFLLSLFLLLSFATPFLRFFLLLFTLRLVKTIILTLLLSHLSMKFLEKMLTLELIVDNISIFYLFWLLVSV